MDFAFLVERTLLKISFEVVRSAVGVVASPRNLIIIPYIVSRLQCVSYSFGCISATNIPYVTVRLAGTFFLCIKKIVLVPDGIIVPTLCYSRPI